MTRSVSAPTQGKNTPSLIIRIILTVLLAASAFPIAALIAPVTAYASAVGELWVGDDIEYGGWSTKSFAVNGNEAYCGDPAKGTPPAGSYTMNEITDPVVAAAVWFGYGGPGFDPSMWPQTWQDSSAMTPDRYRALTHIVISDLFVHNSHYSYGQCDDDFIEWCQNNVIGYAFDDGHLFDTNTITYRINSQAFELLGDGSARDDFPPGFTAYLMPTVDDKQVIITFEYHPYGSMTISKTSANPQITNSNDCYSLSGAVFGIYSDPWCSDLVRTVTTGSDGVAQADEILTGSYYVKEISAPKGYALSSSTYSAQVGAGSTSYVSVSDLPQNDPAYLVVQKHDGERGYMANNLPQGSASLEGAEYRLDYYDGYYDTVDAAQRSGAPTRTWVVRTDADGFAALDDGYIVSGGALFKNSNGHATLPLGTLVIRETKAPEGYLLDGEHVYVQQIRPDGYLETVYTYVTPIHPEQVIRGGISIEKRDLESGLLTPLGGASLDGTEFEIVNRSEHSVIVDGIDHAPGNVVKTISAVDGVASTDADSLPYGSYSIKETKPGNGYLHTDQEERFFNISNDGEIVRLEGDDAARNQVKRGDVELVKARETDQHRLDGIPFLITSETTGEAHVFVTDDNGEAKTEAAWNPHTQRTNANDDAISEDGDVDEAKLDPEAGVWFGITTEGWSVDADDDLGAMPYDTYRIEELRCSKNTGLELVTMTSRVSRHSYQIDLGTVDDQPAGQVTISTTARDGHDGDKTVSADPQAKVIDRVEYAGLTVGAEYVIEGTLIDKESGKPITDADGAPVTAERTFTAETASGYVELEFVFDATRLAGSSAVAFEVLKDAKLGTTVASHEDIEDFDQTVKMSDPEIGTTATDPSDGDHRIVTHPSATIIDTVTYRGLMADAEYTVVGTLMLVTEDGAEPLIDADGEPITASTVFTPKDANGSVDVTFTFDSTKLSGEKLVAFERLYRGEATIADHEDPGDPSQTVEVVEPEVGTYAFDAIDSDKSVVADRDARIIDRVSYASVAPGESYALYGVIYEPGDGLPAWTGSTDDRAARERIADELAKTLGFASDPADGMLPKELDATALDALLDELAASGGIVWGSTRFTPDASSGTAEVSIPFDASSCSGARFVVLEALVRESEGGCELVAVHDDLGSEEQSFDVIPSRIGTLAIDKTDGDHSVLASKDACVIDTVSYEGLVPGQEYELLGVLMDIATGKELMVADKTVTASMRFTPNASTGEVALEFPFDSTVVQDHDAVVFEYLSKNGEPVAEHADLEYEAQSFHVTDSTLTKNTTGFYDKTGVDQRGLFGFLAILLVGALFTAGFGLRKLIASCSKKEREQEQTQVDPDDDAASDETEEATVCEKADAEEAPLPEDTE